MNNSSVFWIKTSVVMLIISLLTLAIILWMQTPQLFEYFNQAFCPH
ncbi:hypothetical protein [Acinetobacter sp. ANC 4910]|nr:hypothetical protein [Acinetobacter sp. ANC 4910]